MRSVLCCLAGLATIVLLVGVAAAAPAPLEVFGGGKVRVYLDLPDGEPLADDLSAPLADFRRCFQSLTGAPLLQTGKQVALFDPTRPGGLRLECTVLSFEDRSTQSSANGTVSLILTPTRRLEQHPLAGPGEKLAWTCSWQRGLRQLQFALTVANQPFQGPGYGPCTCATLELPYSGPQPPVVQLAVELRHANGQDMRGGYRLAGGDWVYTDWFDPARAGSDLREPGVSDKLGPQAWAADWPAQWAGQTAAYVTGYSAKLREGRMRVDDVRLTQGGQVVFSDDFAAADGAAGEALPCWRRGPRQGAATVTDGSLLFAPDPEGWSTVGLVAATPPPPLPAAAVPLRLKLLDLADGQSRFDPQIAQGWRRETDAGGITLAAWTNLGLHNALYALLDQWGCRWVMVGDLGECIPRVTKLTVPLGVVAPPVYNDVSMSPCGSGTPYADFYIRNQSGYLNWVWMGHYWLTALPPKVHFATHPEWYSLIAGQRQPKQLCTSNPEVVAAMIEAAKAFLRGSPQRVCFPMEPMDCIDFCECANCRALDPPGRFTDGAPSVTDRVLHFANQVAAGIKDEFPDRYVGFYAYWSHVAVPVREKPAPNVLIGITRSDNCLLHLTPTRSCPTSDFHALIRAWRKLTPNVYAYEYDPIPWTGGLPCPTWLHMGKSLSTMFLDLGVKGSYSDWGVKPAGQAGIFLNRYLPLRLKVNPRLRPEDVLHDMCQVFFGPAAQPLERHYLVMAQMTRHTHPGLGGIGCGTTFYHRLFTPEQIKQARAALDQGLAAARGHGLYEQRVAMVDLSQQYLEAYLGGVWAAQARDYDRSVAEFDRMDRTLGALTAKGWADAQDAPVRAKTMRLKALAEHFPDRLGYVTAWKLLGPFDNSANTSAQVREPFEPIQNLAPVKLAEGRAAAWWDYPSPGGFLNLETALGPRRGAWTLSYAFAATTYVAPRATPAQLKLDSFFPCRVFLNGEEVFVKPGLNADCPDRLSVDVRLKEGPNLIVFKLCQTQVTGDSFPWGLYLRVVPEDAREVVILPERWPFHTDPQDVGTREGWFAPGYDDRGWQAIRVGQAWEGAIGAYDGAGWYRVRFAAPAQLPPKLALLFAGADEQAWVYLNGTLIGERTMQSTGKPVGEIWEQPFTIPVPAGVLKPGAENVLVVRVHDSAYAGGLYRSVKLVAAP